MAETEVGFEGLGGFAFDGFAGVEGVVRGEDDVGAGAEAEEGAVVVGEGGGVAGAEGGGEGGFFVVDVEGGPGKVAGVEGGFQGERGGEFAAGDVDEDGAAGRGAKKVGGEVAAVGRGEVHGAEDDVGSGQGVGGGGVGDVGVAVDRVDADGCCAEGAEDGVDFVADVADAEDGGGLAGEFESGEVVALEAVELRELPGESAQEGEGQEEGLLGDGADAVAGEVAEGGAGGVVWQGGAVGEEVVVARGAGEDAREGRGPGGREDGLGADGDDRGGVTDVSLLIDIVLGKA